MATTTLTVTVEDANGNLHCRAGGDAVGERRPPTPSAADLPARPMPAGVFTHHADLDAWRRPRPSRRAKSGVHETTVRGLHGRARPRRRTRAVGARARRPVTADGSGDDDADGDGGGCQRQPVAARGGDAASSADRQYRSGPTTGITNASGVFTHHARLDRRAAPRPITRERRRRPRNQQRWTFTAGAASAAKSSVVAEPATVAADGVSTTTLTVTVEDAHGNLVSAIAVTLASSGDAPTPSVDEPGTTNAQRRVHDDADLDARRSPRDHHRERRRQFTKPRPWTFTAGAASAATSSVGGEPGDGGGGRGGDDDGDGDGGGCPRQPGSECGGDAGEQRRRRRHVWVDHRHDQRAGRVQRPRCRRRWRSHRDHHRERRRAFTKPRRWTSRPGGLGGELERGGEPGDGGGGRGGDYDGDGDGGGCPRQPGSRMRR